MEKTKPLNMVQLEIDVRKLFLANRALSSPRVGLDAGYALHCLFAELFGTHAPKPYAFDVSDQGVVRILGYTSSGKDELQEHAATFAAPDALEALGERGVALKEMPLSSLREGARFGFKTRVVPISRKTLREGEGTGILEQDVYLVRRRAGAEHEEKVLSREEVYGEWLTAKLALHNAATLESCRLTAFSCEKTLRRSHKPARGSKVVSVPSCTLEGVLTVGDPSAFIEMLRRGVGRHKAFGFGLVLLKPAGQPRC